jgi:hypothetical protein
VRLPSGGVGGQTRRSSSCAVRPHPSSWEASRIAAEPEKFDISDSKLTLAKQLVHLVWGSGKIPSTITAEYEGAK